MAKLTKYQQTCAKIAALRINPDLTSVRYDEIVSLRGLLLDILETVDRDDGENCTDRFLDKETPAIVPFYLIQRINKRSKSWGRKGDCV